MKKIFLSMLSMIVVFLGVNVVSADENYYNDECGLYLLPASINKIEKRVLGNISNLDKNIASYSYKILENNLPYGLEFLGESQNYVYFLSNSKVYRTIKNGNEYHLSDLGYLSEFNDIIDNKKEFLFVRNGYVYYKNPNDDLNIYMINEECSNYSLKGKKISKQNDINYIANNNSSVFYINSNGNLFKISNRGDILDYSQYDFGIKIDKFLLHDKLKEDLYYITNGNLYKQSIKNPLVSNPIKIYDIDLTNYNFIGNDDENIYFYNSSLDKTYLLKKDGSSISLELFYNGYFGFLFKSGEYYFFEGYLMEEGSMWEADPIYIYRTKNPLNGDVEKITINQESQYLYNNGEYLYYGDGKLTGKLNNIYNFYINTIFEEQPIQIPTPTNLNQYIKSPLLEQEDLIIGSKIGRFQSGSGIILEAEIQNDTTNSYNMIFEVYKHGQTIPLYDSSIEITSGTGQVVIPYLGEGDFIWKVKTTDNNGNTSEVVDYSTSQAWEIDFSIFEGFEPYSYGFSFENGSPANGILTGGYKFTPIYGDNKIKLEKIPGTKWNLFYKAFDTEGLVKYNEYGQIIDERKLFYIYELLGLNKDITFINKGSCFGLSTLALLKYQDDYFKSKNIPNYLEQNYNRLYTKLKNGSIYDLIDNPSFTLNQNWDIYSDDLEDIFSLQLFQLSRLNYTLNDAGIPKDNNGNFIFNPNEVLETLKNNPDKKYILNFEWKENGQKVGHSVVPYRVDGNRIYIYDNVSPYGEKYNSYNEYIDVKDNGKIYISSKSDVNEDDFTLIGLMDIEEMNNNGNKSKPIGFNLYDILYTLNGNSDILLTDINGNKTGYKNGEIYEEIPGTRIVVNYAGDTTDNTWKQIYLPQKLENLTIEINGKVEENYDLMIAGGDYYTKLEGINTSSGQTDVFNISRESIKIDFDDNKNQNNTYNILVDDFQNNSTGTVMLGNLETINGKQELDINWTEVLNDSDTAVIYSKDLDNDGIQESTENLKPILDYSIEPEPEILLGNISGKIGLYLPQEICKKIGNKNCSQIVKQLEKEILNKTTKLILEKQEEEIEGNNKNKNKDKDKKQNKKGKDKNKEEKQYIELDNKGNYKIVDLEPGMYKLSLELKKGWTTKTPQTGYYMLEITNGENYVDKDFQVINKLLEQLIKNFKIK